MDNMDLKKPIEELTKAIATLRNVLSFKFENLQVSTVEVPAEESEAPSITKKDIEDIMSDLIKNKKKSSEVKALLEKNGFTTLSSISTDKYDIIYKGLQLVNK